MQDYEYISTIGEGGYGEVWRCRERSTGRIVAIKGFKQAHTDKAVMRLATREAKMLYAVNHPNLVKLLNAFRSKSGRVYMVFEYAESCVRDELDRFPQGLPSCKLKSLIWQLLNAVAYLHDNKIVHRDIKPANILLDSSGLVKLCDFGFARRTHCSPKDVQRCTSYVVTRWYRAPEVLVNDHYGPSADVWSIGCTIAEIATGRVLFPGDSTADQIWLIMRCLGPLTLNQTSRMASDPYLRGVAFCVPRQHKPLRARLPECDAPLFQLVEACLRPDPQRRPTVRELLNMPYFADMHRGRAAAGTPQPQQQPRVEDGRASSDRTSVTSNDSDSSSGSARAAQLSESEAAFQQSVQSPAASQLLAHESHSAPKPAPSGDSHLERSLMRALSASANPAAASRADTRDAVAMDLMATGGSSQVLPFSQNCTTRSPQMSPGGSSIGELEVSPMGSTAEDDLNGSKADSTMATIDLASTTSGMLRADPALACAVSTIPSSPFTTVHVRSAAQSRPASSVASGGWEHVATPTGAPALRQQHGVIPPHVRPTGQPAAFARQRDGSWTTGMSERQGSRRHQLMRACSVSGIMDRTRVEAATGKGHRGASENTTRSCGGGEEDKSVMHGGGSLGRSLRTTASRILSLFSSSAASLHASAEGTSERQALGDGHAQAAHEVTTPPPVPTSASTVAMPTGTMGACDTHRTASLNPQRRSRLGLVGANATYATSTMHGPRSESQPPGFCSDSYEYVTRSPHLTAASTPVNIPNASTTPGSLAPDQCHLEKLLIAGWNSPGHVVGSCPSGAAVPQVAGEGRTVSARHLLSTANSVPAGSGARTLGRSITGGSNQLLNASQSVPVRAVSMVGASRPAGTAGTAASIPYASPVASVSLRASSRIALRGAATPTVFSMVSEDDVVVSPLRTSSRSLHGSAAWVPKSEDAASSSQRVDWAWRQSIAETPGSCADSMVGEESCCGGYREGKGSSSGVFSKLVRVFKGAAAKVSAK